MVGGGWRGVGGGGCGGETSIAEDGFRERVLYVVCFSLLVERELYEYLFYG